MHVESDVRIFAPTDLVITLVTFVLAALWVGLWKHLVHRQLVSSLVARKVLHMTCAPAFSLLWPLYTKSTGACFLASVVPIVYATVLILSTVSSSSGFESVKHRTHNRDISFSQALGRPGDKSHALKGPIFYTVVLIAITLLLFQTPAAIIAIAQLSFGDAAAEVIGRNYGSTFRWHLSWDHRKSVTGSIAFVCAAFFGTSLSLEWLRTMGLSRLHPVSDVIDCASIAAISVSCAVVELAPISLIIDDNLAVAVTAVFFSSIFFGHDAF